MLAERHLAKDAFELHLLLQRLEDLVDIVVTDENLHVVFLFNPTVDRPNGQGDWRTDRNCCRAYTASGRLSEATMEKSLDRNITGRSALTCSSKNLRDACSSITSRSRIN